MKITTMETNRVLTVQWKEHSQQLSQGLWDLFTKEYMVDTNVSFYGDIIKVHSLLLTVFLKAFNQINSDKPVKEMNLDYVANQKEDVHSLVEFIYTGKTTIAEDRIEYVRCLAQDLDFKGFTSSIEECLQSDMDGNGVEQYSCLGLVSVVEDNDNSTDVGKPLEENEPSTEVTTKNGQSLSQDIESVKCRFSLRKTEASSLNGLSSTSETTTTKKKPFKRTSVRVTKAKRTNSELTVTVNLRARSQRIALRHNEKSTDFEDQSQTLINHFSEVTEDGTTEFSEEEDSDEYVTSKAQRRRKRKTSTVPIKRRYEIQNKSAFKRHKPENLKCDKCDKEYKSKTSFLIHKKSSCGQDLQFVCNYCGHQTLRRSTLEEHLASKHKMDLKGNPLEENVKCTKCDFVCYARHQLKYHVLRKHTEKKFECPQCEFAAVVRSELKKHISIRHLKERNYVCDECGVSFQTSGALNGHIRTKHKGMKLYKCNECNKEYVCHHSYKIHMSKHTGTEKFYVCHVCGHSCNKRYNLGTHMKKHHGLQMEPVKKVYAPRQNATNEMDITKCLV